MKTIFRIFISFLVFLNFVACNHNDEAGPEALEVTPANLHGSWKLVEWNGSPLQEGSFLYITFNRKDKTYIMLDKLSSMYPNRKTGNFEIEKDEKIGYIINGDYDFGNGKWNNSYIVTDILANGTMVWTVKGDRSDTQKFERCDKIPSEIE